VIPPSAQLKPSIVSAPNAIGKTELTPLISLIVVTVSDTPIQAVAMLQ
jgi:hypothetical protein